MLLEACFARFRAMRETHPEFPRVLPAGPDEPVKPMLLGIRQRATTLLPEGGARKRLAKAIDLYARSPAYYQACLAPGAMRWSDDGTTPVEPVTDEQRAVAAERLARRRREFEAKAPLPPAKKQVPPPRSEPSKVDAVGSPKPVARPPVVVEIRKPRRPARRRWPAPS